MYPSVRPDQSEHDCGGSANTFSAAIWLRTLLPEHSIPVKECSQPRSKLQPTKKRFPTPQFSSVNGCMHTVHGTKSKLQPSKKQNMRELLQPEKGVLLPDGLGRGSWLRRGWTDEQKNAVAAMTLWKGYGSRVGCRDDGNVLLNGAEVIS